jgi:hypothetical protein
MAESQLPIYGFPAHSFCLSCKWSPLSVPYVLVGRGIRGVGTPVDGMAEQFSFFLTQYQHGYYPKNRHVM